MNDVIERKQVLAKSKKPKEEYKIKGSAPDEIAAGMLHKFGENGIFFRNEKFYLWIDDRWQTTTEDKLRGIILKMIPPRTFSTTKFNTALDILRSLAASPEPTPDENVIHFAHGKYLIKESEFIPYKMEDHIISTFAADYAPGAACPRWLLFLNEIFENDNDRDKKIDLLQEFIGYSMTRSTRHEMTLLMVGSGANGKSTVLKALKKMFGDEAFSSLELSQFENKFHIPALENKYINICNEVGYKNRFPEETFKAIVSGDTQFADVKFKRPYQFEPFAKLIFASNDLPTTGDTSAAFFRRWLILKFNRTFAKDKRDKYLSDKLAEEVNGIANWALEGLHRLNRVGYFTEPDSHKTELKRYRIENSSVACFADECMEVAPGDSVKYGWLYKEYVVFCYEGGYRPKSKQNFKKELLRAIPTASTSNRNGNIYFVNVAVVNHEFVESDLPY
jgi:putative DNA primase/helicase